MLEHAGHQGCDRGVVEIAGEIGEANLIMAIALALPKWSRAQG